MFERMLEDLKDLDGTTIEIYGEGEYPTKRRTKVQHVAKWQNDGTDRGIKPARFVQRAAGKHRHWQGVLSKAVADQLFRHADRKQSLTEVGLKVAYDINKVIDRIRTGRLKRSMRPRIVEKR